MEGYQPESVIVIFIWRVHEDIFDSVLAYGLEKFLVCLPKLMRLTRRWVGCSYTPCIFWQRHRPLVHLHDFMRVFRLVEKGIVDGTSLVFGRIGVLLLFSPLSVAVTRKGIYVSLRSSSISRPTCTSAEAN